MLLVGLDKVILPVDKIRERFCCDPALRDQRILWGELNVSELTDQDKELQIANSSEERLTSAHFIRDLKNFLYPLKIRLPSSNSKAPCRARGHCVIPKASSMIMQLGL
jgi:hypothetical protein